MIFARLSEWCGRRAALVLGVWVAGAVWCTVALPALSSVGADQTSFLPADARSRQTQDLLRLAFPEDPGLDPAVIIVRRSAGLSDADRAYVGHLASFLVSPAATEHVQAVQSAVNAPELTPLLRSADGRAELVVLTLQAGPLTEGSNEAVNFVRRHLEATAPDDLEHHVTGLSALFADQAQVLTDGLDRTLLATVVLLLLILVLVYRSVVAPLLSLVAIGLAFLVARGVVAALAERGVEVASMSETWMVMMAFGAGTDYCLFVMSRYREELGAGDGRPAALRRTGMAVGPVITASGVTVVLGVLAFLAGRLLIVRATGPVFAVSVALVLAAGLTLTPALLRLAGRYAFWPARSPVAATAPRRWVRMADRVEARPVTMLVGGLLVLLVPSAALLSLRQSFDLVNELPASAESRLGFEALTAHYPSGALSPLYLVIQSDRSLLEQDAMASIDRLTDTLRTDPGWAEVRSVTQPAGAPLTAATITALTGGPPDPSILGLDQSQVGPVMAALASPGGLRLDGQLLSASPTLRRHAGFFLSADGRTTRLALALRGNPYDRSTFSVVRHLDDRAADMLVGSPLAGSRLVVGGPGAFLVDFQDGANGDFRAISVLVVAAALVILALLLRSAVAPLYLLPTAVLSFTAALGLTVIVFQGILDHPGLSFWLPVWLFTILVALGADYNIFITGRIREELDRGAAPVEAVRNGLILTGPVITSAGLILAGTFSAALLSPLPFLQQSGFAIAAGILIDTFVVRTLVVPAVAVVLGRYAFWPSGASLGGRSRPVAVALSAAGIVILTLWLVGVAADRPTHDHLRRIEETRDRSVETRPPPVSDPRPGPNPPQPARS